MVNDVEKTSTEQVSTENVENVEKAAGSRRFVAIDDDEEFTYAEQRRIIHRVDRRLDAVPADIQDIFVLSDLIRRNDRSPGIRFNFICYRHVVWQDDEIVDRVLTDAKSDKSQVQRMVPFGPTGGAALNLTLVSYRGTCGIGVHRDVAAIPDGHELVEDLRSGFDEVLALGDTESG